MSIEADEAPQDIYLRWKGEIDLASNARGYKDWLNRGEKIVKRYRDDRGSGGESNSSTTTEGAKFNILWSNVQTLLPALYAKPPKAVVERRYLDRDKIGRLASTILERALTYEIDAGYFSGTIRRIILDRLLPGRGVAWVRYEPTFRAMPSKASEGKDDAADSAGMADEEEPAEGEGGYLQEEKISESVCLDYVDWRDFMTAGVRTWEECPWIARRVYMDRNELVERFGKKVGAAVTLDWHPSGDKSSSQADDRSAEKQRKAKVWEIWHKPAREVIWIADGYPDAPLDVKPDPLKLEGFWPTPKPLSATLTNDSLVPVPDYVEYQDQARELDDLTARIESLTKSIKAAGCYDASVPALARILDEGMDNQLVAVEDWAAFAQKGGLEGGISMLPIKDIANVLMQLYDARDRVKQVMFEVTGLSDIVRGQSAQGSAKTATEQRIKGQFASLRLNDMQGEVGRYVGDCLRIMGEIIAEHYSPMTLYLISGYEHYAQEQFGASATGGGLPAPQPPVPGMAPAPDPMQEAKQAFIEAIKLLRDDKLRGFRIDIEANSIIEPDQEAGKQAVVELFGALANFLPQALELGNQQPKLVPVVGKLILFGLRRFELGRDLESAFEQAIDDMEKAAANPQQKPSPEEIKAQAEIQKQQFETQRLQQQAQIDQQKGQQDLFMAKQKNAMDIERMRAELDIKREELEIKRQELAMKHQMMQIEAQAKTQVAAIDMENTERKAAIEADGMERQAKLSAEADERASEQNQAQHDNALEIMSEKTKQAKAKPRKAAK